MLSLSVSGGWWQCSVGVIGLFLVEKVEGEEIQLHKVTRSEMGAYMCIATNGVPPAVGKTVQLNVNCKDQSGRLDNKLSFLKEKKGG